jgi:DNA-binding CsgD family transcriptional regulator
LGKRNSVDEPVLLLHGGSPVARDILSRHLRSLNLEFRLVVMPPEWPSTSCDGETCDVTTFLGEVGARISSLSQKELVVLDLILEGLTNKAIGLKLDLTIRAIEFRKASVMKKMNVASHTALVGLITKFQILQRYRNGQTAIEPLQRDAASFKSREAKFPVRSRRSGKLPLEEAG